MCCKWHIRHLLYSPGLSLTETAAAAASRNSHTASEAPSSSMAANRPALLPRLQMAAAGRRPPAKRWTTAASSSRTRKCSPWCVCDGCCAIAPFCWGIVFVYVVLCLSQQFPDKKVLTVACLCWTLPVPCRVWLRLVVGQQVLDNQALTAVRACGVFARVCRSCQQFCATQLCYVPTAAAALPLLLPYRCCCPTAAAAASVCLRVAACAPPLPTCTVDAPCPINACSLASEWSL